MDAQKRIKQLMSERGELKLAAGDEKSGNEDIEYAKELTAQLPEKEGDEGIEKKVNDKYKSIDPYGVFWASYKIKWNFGTKFSYKMFVYLN